jgi:hypothetical protein
LSKERLGVGGPALRETHLRQPHERRHVIGLQRQRLLEETRRLGRIVGQARHLGQVVGPAHVAGRELAGAGEAAFGRLVELGRDEQPAHIAVGRGPLGRRQRRLPDHARHGGVPLAQLRLHVGRRPGDVRQRHRRRLRPHLLPRAVRGHDDAGETEGRGASHRPVPSVKVV